MATIRHEPMRLTRILWEIDDPAMKGLMAGGGGVTTDPMGDRWSLAIVDTGYGSHFPNPTQPYLHKYIGPDTHVWPVALPTDFNWKASAAGWWLEVATPLDMLIWCIMHESEGRHTRLMIGRLRGVWGA